MYISMKQARALLPRVGDVRMEVPTIGKTGTCHQLTTEEPQECTVVEVYPAQLWYRVKFKNTGFFECYKVPKYKPYYEAWPSYRRAKA